MTARRTLPIADVPKAPTEAQFQRQVIDLARLLGYRAWHNTYAIGSDRGWPDLVLVRPADRNRPGRVVFVELKGPRGVVTLFQREWLDYLAAAGQETHVWKSDSVTLQEITEILRK